MKDIDVIPKHNFSDILTFFHTVCCLCAERSHFLKFCNNPFVLEVPNEANKQIFIICNVNQKLHQKDILTNEGQKSLLVTNWTLFA